MHTSKLVAFVLRERQQMAAAAAAPKTLPNAADGFLPPVAARQFYDAAIPRQGSSTFDTLHRQAVAEAMRVGADVHKLERLAAKRTAYLTAAVAVAEGDFADVDSADLEFNAAVMDVLRYVLPALEVKSPQRQRKPKVRRKRRQDDITELQMKAVMAVMECDDNIAAAARKLGRDRSTIEEAYKIGRAKLGNAFIGRLRKPKLVRLPEDQRGQVQLQK